MWKTNLYNNNSIKPFEKKTEEILFLDAVCYSKQVKFYTQINVTDVLV